MKLNTLKTDKNTLVMQLERNQKDLDQLKSKLSSYICEPKTRTFFERFELLKYNLDRLTSTNKEIIHVLNEHGHSISSYIEKVKQQFDDFSVLQKEVDAYVTGIRNS